MKKTNSYTLRRTNTFHNIADNVTLLSKPRMKVNIFLHIKQKWFQPVSTCTNWKCSCEKTFNEITRQILCIFSGYNKMTSLEHNLLSPLASMHSKSNLKGLLFLKMSFTFSIIFSPIFSKVFLKESRTFPSIPSIG